ncbi:MAG: hypothetical protein AB8E82_13870 [Aureispira sp.]
MARLLLLLWVVVISIQSLYKGLVYTYYVCNKAYIIEQLCENKAQPALKCEGKCHLKKVMNVHRASTETKQQPYLPNLEEVKLPPLFFQTVEPLLAWIDQTAFSSTGKAIFVYQFDYTYQPLHGVWHPPRLA